jgi:hypothetical protein
VRQEPEQSILPLAVPSWSAHASGCVLAFTLTASLLKICPARPLKLIAAACSVFLVVLFVPAIHDVGLEAGQTRVDEFHRDVQRQYAIRRCCGTDMVPFINHSDKAVELCVRLSRTKFCGAVFSSAPNIPFKIDLLEPNSLSLMTTFESELNAHMRQLLLHSTAASRRRLLRAPSLANSLIGGAVIALLCVGLPCFVWAAFRIQKVDSYEMLLEDLGWLGKLISRFSPLSSFLNSRFEYFHSMQYCWFFRMINYATKSNLFSALHSFAKSMFLDNFISRKIFTVFQQLPQNLFFSRIFNLWESMVDGDKIQELKLKKVNESRAIFVKLFLDVAKQGDFKSREDSALFQSTKVSFDDTRICDETWLKNLEKLWSIWSDEAGDLRLTNVISWTQINLCSAVLSKDEVYRLQVLVTSHLLMFNMSNIFLCRLFSRCTSFRSK